VPVPLTYALDHTGAVSPFPNRLAAVILPGEKMSGRGTVLVIGDSPDETRLIEAAIDGETFAAIVCTTAGEGLAAVARDRPVAALVDWALPDRAGVEVCRELRARDALLPIIFFSGKSDDGTVARGLDAGADDFVIKPFHRIELIARIEAHIRKARAGAAGRGAATATGYRFGDVEVDLAAREVRVAGDPVGLGPLEFRLIEYLVQNAGIAISREQIMSQVYGYDADISTERVDLLARRVRAKLGEGPTRGGHLVAVPGYGYRWERRRREEAPATLA
jgi:two-component system KDP operon response regulator KdpE